MRSFKQFIKEAKNPAPSALKKFNQGSREVENTYIAGDIYDLSDGNRYTQTDKYYQGDGNGYIMDKNGNVYDVKCSESTGDAGRIAGGSYHIYVTILRVGPEQQNISLSGYSAVFSSSSSKTYGSLISDIKDGIYLEDYLAYHKDDIGYDSYKADWVKALIKAGDGEGSRTVKMKKRDSKINKEESFNQRYCVIKDKMDFSCTSGHSLKYYEGFYAFNKICAEIRPSSTKNSGKTRNGMFGTEKAEEAVKVPEEVHNAIVEEYGKLAEDVVAKIFGSADLKGLKFEFNVWFEGKGGYDNPAVFGWDIKKKQFVVMDLGKRKVLDRKYELRLTTVYNQKWHGEELELSKYALKFMEDASKIIVKSLGSESKYVADNYKSVMWGKGYWKPEHKAGEAKEICKEQFAKMKSEKTFNPNKAYYVSPDVVAQVVGGKSYQKFFVAEKPKVETTESPDMTPEVTNGPDKPKGNSKSAAETYGKAYGPAKEKMEKWHAGTRKQNLKNCNDGKLRMNFAICKELGYDEECKQIAAEAKKRGIVLESRLSLTEYIQGII